MFLLESFFEVGLCLGIGFVGVFGVWFLLKRELRGEFVFGGLGGLGGGRGALIHVSELEVSLYIRGDGGRGVLRCSGRGRRFCEWLWRVLVLACGEDRWVLGRGVLSGGGSRWWLCVCLWRGVGWGWSVCGWRGCVSIKWGWGRRGFFIRIEEV